MTHDDFKEKLFNLRDQKLSKLELGQLALHLESCETCCQAAKRWEKIQKFLADYQNPAPSENFVNAVMIHLTTNERPAYKENRWALPNWLVPVLGYCFAIILMFAAIAKRELPANAEGILLSDMPQNSHWAVSAEQPDTGELIGM